MDSSLTNLTLSKLAQDKSTLDEKLANLEKQLLVDNLTTQNEIDLLLVKQKNIENTYNFINQLQQIENDVEMTFAAFKKAERDKKVKYTDSRINQLQAWVDDNKIGANRTKETSLGHSYQESVNYYQSQISSLLSSLES